MKLFLLTLLVCTTFSLTLASDDDYESLIKKQGISTKEKDRRIAKSHSTSGRGAAKDLATKGISRTVSSSFKGASHAADAASRAFRSGNVIKGVEQSGLVLARPLGGILSAPVTLAAAGGTALKGEVYSAGSATAGFLKKSKSLFRGNESDEKKAARRQKNLMKAEEAEEGRLKSYSGGRKWQIDMAQNLRGTRYD